jgi:glucose/arabinose dehydrogenase
MHILLATLALISVLLFPINAASQTPHIQLQSITDTRLTVPTFVTNSHDGTGRMFVLEQGGRIMVVQPGTRAATVFLDLTDRVMTTTERGLLGLTFHPQFTDNHEFFVDYTRKPDGAIVVGRYKVSATNPNVAEANETVVLTIPHLAAEHNGGMIEFGSDGYRWRHIV